MRFSTTKEGAAARRGIVRVLLALLVAPLIVSLLAPQARADADDYSFYKLSSNAVTYFGEMNSPGRDGDDPPGLDGKWDTVTGSPAAGGSFVGYADTGFSSNKAINWLFADVSMSSKTIRYDTFAAANQNGKYNGILDYVHYGAALRNLGFDSMNSGTMSNLLSGFSGGIVWFLYIVSLAAGWLFWVITKLLQMLNPFKWFYTGVARYNSTWADGMVNGDSHTVLTSAQQWIGNWYDTLVNLSWSILVPLFLVILVVSLLFVKQGNRGSAIKKFCIRLVFLALGIPLLGSIYTATLDSFSGDPAGQQAGPTRVVLSNYVDFGAWMNDSRLAVPSGASISWDNGQAGPNALIATRTSALAINKASNEHYNTVGAGVTNQDAEEAWRNGTGSAVTNQSDDLQAISDTIGLIGRYITHDEVAASDFESSMKTAISDANIDKKELKRWFVEKKTYGDVDKFGAETDDGDKSPMPADHPVLSIGNPGNAGLQSSSEGETTTVFTTSGVTQHCGLLVVDGNGNPVPCNMSPMAAYNYLNTKFGTDSLTVYSSNKVMSGLSRENHMAVSQVGSGPSRLMYWANTVVLLGSIGIVGLWYGVGMLSSSIRRMVGLVINTPFALLGALSGIARFISYTLMLICEILVTVFLYQFISEFLVTLPSIIEGPISDVVMGNSIFSNPILARVLVLVLTGFSIAIIIGLTAGLLKVRKSALGAIDEAMTRVVNVFVGADVSPMAPRTPVAPALAAGLGSGAGMALGQRLADRGGYTDDTDGKGRKVPGSWRPDGLRASRDQVGPGNTKGIGSGRRGPDDKPGGPSGSDGTPPGGPPPGGGGSGAGDRPADSGGPLETSDKLGTDAADKQTAERLRQQGGLTDYGKDGAGRDGAKGKDGRTLGATGKDGQHGRNGRDGSGRNGIVRPVQPARPADVPGGRSGSNGRPGQPGQPGNGGRSGRPRFTSGNGNGTGSNQVKPVKPRTPQAPQRPSQSSGSGQHKTLPTAPQGPRKPSTPQSSGVQEVRTLAPKPGARNDSGIIRRPAPPKGGNSGGGGVPRMPQPKPGTPQAPQVPKAPKSR